MTYAPQALLDLRHYLQPYTGLDDWELGIVGDEDHNGGYHHGWDDRAGDGDYSWDESSRDWSHKTNAAAAMDIGMFDRLRELSVWLVEQCEANRRDPTVNKDCADIREIIYSADGEVVQRWDRLGIRTSGDSSHLTHTHISYHRDAEQRDKTAAFKRFFEGDDMTPHQEMLLSNAYQVGFELLRRADPAMFLIDVDTQSPTYGQHIKIPNLLQQQLNDMQAKLDQLLSASGGGGPVGGEVGLTDAALADVRRVVDEELDEQSRGGADNDTKA